MWFQEQNARLQTCFDADRRSEDICQPRDIPFWRMHFPEEWPAPESSDDEESMFVWQFLNFQLTIVFRTSVTSSQMQDEQESSSSYSEDEE